MTRYQLKKMETLGMSQEEYEEYLSNKKMEHEIRNILGDYKYYKFKALGMTVIQIKDHLINEEKNKQIIKKIGYRNYHKLVSSGAKTIEEYEKLKEKEKEVKKCVRDEKNKIRYKTIRYIERYCDIERKCQICGEKAEIHHPNYKEYLKVNFLCKKHHTDLHNFELIPPEVIDLEILNKKNERK